MEDYDHSKTLEVKSLMRCAVSKAIDLESGFICRAKGRNTVKAKRSCEREVNAKLICCALEKITLLSQRRNQLKFDKREESSQKL